MVDLSKVKVGDTLIKRDGAKILVNQIDICEYDTPYRFNSGLSFTKDGYWSAWREESGNDIVEHIPQAQVVENIDVTKIQSGDVLVFRDGTVEEVCHITCPAINSPFTVTFDFVQSSYSYTKEGDFLPGELCRWDIMRVERDGVTIMERKEQIKIEDVPHFLTPLTKKQVYLINGKLFSTETLSTINNLELLKEIGVQVEVKDVL